MSKPRVGVFVCECGTRIASVLAMGTLQREARALPGVAVVRRLPYACSPDGLAAIGESVAEQRLERVVVAGCTPRTLAPRFRRACAAAGLDGNLLDLVDIREGCAWVHASEPATATAKAVDLIRMGVARVAERRPGTAIVASVVPAALVVGGGLAGMTAALTLGRAGMPVVLVEREAALGGLLRQVHTLSPDGRGADRFLAGKVAAVTSQPQISVLLKSQVIAVSGTSGRYTVTVAGPRAGESQLTTFEVGAIIVATGACARRPPRLGCQDRRKVLSQLEFERELRDMAHGTGPAAGQDGTDGLDDVVMILCAGQRDERVPYCSAVCCQGALKQALELKARNPEANVTVLFRDLYLGDEEDARSQFGRAQQAGIEFIHYAASVPPIVTGEAVEVREDPGGCHHRLPYDRAILATPLLPQPDASVLAHLLGIAQDENGFFPQARHRLRPENDAGRGIYICGTAHGPAGWAQAEFQATSAASSALRHLRAGALHSQAPVAAVKEELCTGCGSCVAACPFGAITLRRDDGLLSLSRVDPLLCKGCGNCAPACPVRAIALPIGGEQEMLAQIEAALPGRPPYGRLRVLAFGCEWSSHAAAELAGARMMPYPPEVRLIRLRCSARFDPTHVLWAFLSGADGVFLGGCPPGQCHYGAGNRFAQERIETLRRQLQAGGFDPRRLRLEWVTPDDPNDFVAKITAFVELVRALGPSPLRMDLEPLGEGREIWSLGQRPVVWLPS